MGRTFIQPGDTVSLTAPGNVVSGQMVLIGLLFGVVEGDAAQDAKMEVGMTGVRDLPKVNGEEFAEGDPVYVNPDALQSVHAHDGEGAFAFIGVAVAAAGSADETARVRLNGVPVAIPDFTS